MHDLSLGLLYPVPYQANANSKLEPREGDEPLARKGKIVS
jgi:hypothetical protein